MFRFRGYYTQFTALAPAVHNNTGVAVFGRLTYPLKKVDLCLCFRLLSCLAVGFAV